MANSIDDKTSTHKQVGKGLELDMELEMIDSKMNTIDEWWPRFTKLNPEISFKEVVQSFRKRHDELIQEKIQWRSNVQLKKRKPRPLYDAVAMEAIYPTMDTSKFDTVRPDFEGIRTGIYENQTHFDVAHPTKFIRNLWNLPEEEEEASGDVWFWPSMGPPEVQSDNADDNGLKFLAFLNPHPNYLPGPVCGVAALGALEVTFPAYETRKSRIHYWTRIVVGIPNGVRICKGFLGWGKIRIDPMGYEDTSGNGIPHSAETGQTVDTVIEDFEYYPGALSIKESTDEYIWEAFDAHGIMVAQKDIPVKLYLGINVYLVGEDTDIDVEGYTYLRIPDWASSYGTYGVYYRRDPLD